MMIAVTWELKTRPRFDSLAFLRPVLVYPVLFDSECALFDGVLLHDNRRNRELGTYGCWIPSCDSSARAPCAP
jgi:hypothetical protein